jgi:hypothetical protein
MIKLYNPFSSGSRIQKECLFKKENSAKRRK